MRPWMIVLSSVLGAMVVVAALVWPELRGVSPSEIAPHLLPHVPVLMIAALAVYALGALLLTTASLVGGLLRARHRMGETEPHRIPSQRDWITAFGSADLERRLAPRLAVAPAQSVRLGGMIVLQSRFSPGEARGEVARLYYLWLARTHFVSALVVLAAVIGLGLARDYGSFPLLASEIPTIAAVLIVVGLLLLSLLGRIAIDVTTEPLLETISQIPAEHVEVGLLRRVVEVLEASGTKPRSIADAAAASRHLPEHLTVMIEQGQRAMLDAIERLSSSTNALEATMRSSIETVGTATRETAAHLSLFAEGGNADVERFSGLQAAIESLTALLERLTKLPASAEEMPRDHHRVTEARLASELRSLLLEIGSAS